jgi:phosphoribosyl 1,2-cyclic phosphodiesterase
VKIVILASGSGGNATLFEAGGTRLLVDAGVGLRELGERLAAAGAGGLPHAILVTHAHQDHVGEALRLSRKLKIPVWASESTERCERLHGRGVQVFGMREPFAIGALTVTPAPVPHDAAQVGLVIEGGGCKAALVTDLGEVPAALPALLRGVSVALIESNHDVEMLQRGPYPAFLKRRIASARGHLSNRQAHALLRALPREVATVALMHLSEANNLPELALESARDALAGRATRILAAPPRETVVIDALARPAPARGEQLALFAV